MVVINALKLSRTMREAGMPEKQAEALAQALDEGLRETVVTRDVLGVTVAEFRTEMTGFKAEIRSDLSAFKAEIRDELSAFKAEIRDELSEFKAEIRNELAEFKAEVRADLANIRVEMAQAVTHLTHKMYAGMVAVVTATGLIQYFVK